MVLVLVHHGAAGQVLGGEACGGDVVKLRITSRHPGGHFVHDNKQVLLPANAALKNSKSQKPKSRNPLLLLSRNLAAKRLKALVLCGLWMFSLSIK